MSDRYTLTRRRFMETAGVTTAGLIVAGQGYSARENNSMLVIDCHAHIYGEDEKTKKAVLGETAHRLWFERRG